MKLIDKIQQLDRLDQLIRMKATGRPKSLAERIGISESTLYGYLKFMKEMGAPIEYSAVRNSYFYTKDAKFHFGFAVKEGGSLQIVGGEINAFDHFKILELI